MSKQAQAAATTARVAVFLAAQLREVAQTRIVQSFGAHARGQGPGPSEEDLKAFAKLLAQEHRLHKSHSTQQLHRQHDPQERQGQQSMTPPQEAASEIAQAQLDAQADSRQPAQAAAKARHPAAPKENLSRVAYASLIDLTRMSLAGKSAPAECCDACSTVNLGSALICKGCNGKLPAYYANHYSEPSQPDEQLDPSLVPDDPAHRQQAEAAPSAQRHLLRRSRVMAPLAAVAIAFLATFVMLVSGLRGNLPEATQQVAKALSPLVEQPVRNSAVVSLVSASPLEAYGSSVAGNELDAAPAPATLATLQESLAESESAVDSSTPVRRMRASLNTAPQRTGGASSAAAPRPVLRTQLARCDSLNFFSRAVCMNNVCSPQAAAATSECASVIRQRRIDEARRNPVLMG